jgi:hypothetical protein
LLPHSNESSVPASEALIFIYVSLGVLLASRTGAGGHVHKQSIFEPGEPQCANACGFFNGDVPKETAR